MKTKTRILIAILFFAISPFGVVKGQQIYTIGASGGDYPTLKEAFGAINEASIDPGEGSVIFQIIDDVTESGEAIIYESGHSGYTFYASITIYPTETGKTISGDFVGALIQLYGASNITIDGRLHDSEGNILSNNKDLTITNTNLGDQTSNKASTIQFINSAHDNTIQYCNIKGSSVHAESGTIYFSTSEDGNGNDYNTIQYNNISPNGSSHPTNTIFSLGSDGYDNSNNSIISNNLINYIAPSNSNGLILKNYNSEWTITSNSIYQTSDYTPTDAFTYMGIMIENTGTNYTIQDNYIGGKEPECEGDPLTKNNNYNNVFYGIYFDASSGSIQGNKIQNINWANSGAAAWYGIYIKNGNTSIGTNTGNAIGDSTGTNSIIITGGATGTNVFGISIGSASTNDCQNNIIGAITTDNSSTNASNFIGIYKDAFAGTTTISNNYIGSSSTSNNIIANSNSTGNMQRVYGIWNKGTGSITIENNTISNLTNNTNNANTSNNGFICGIYTETGTNIITNNNINNLTIFNANNTPSSAMSVSGISMLGSTNKTIIGNTIYNLTNNRTDYTGTVAGIVFIGTTSETNTVSGNFIYNLSVHSSSTAAKINGIRILSGKTNYSNNIISLGGDTKTEIMGIYENGVANNNNNLYFNTIYIYGNVASGATNKSYALYSNGANNIKDFENNVLCNTRSTTSGSSLHYAAWFNYTSNTNLSLDYNDYYVSGTGGVLGRYNNSDKTTIPIVTARDTNSLNLDPLFKNAGSTVALDYKIGYDFIGKAISGFTKDYNNTIDRENNSMGAIELPVNKWKGTSSQNWGTSGNWTSDAFPIPGASITFDENPSSDCILDQDRVVKNINNAQSTYKMVTNGHKLTITGALNFTNDAKIDASETSSTIKFNGTSQQTIPAGAFYNNQITNFEIDNPSGLIALGTLKINGIYTKTNGLLDVETNKVSLEFNGTSQQTIPSEIFTNDQIYNLTINNTNNVILNDDNLRISGTLTKTSGEMDVFTNSSNIQLNGTEGQQAIPDNFFTNNKVYHLIVNNSNGVAMGGSLEISNNLEITSGKLSLSGTLTLSGAITNTISNGLIGSTSSNLTLKGDAKSIQFDQSAASKYSLNVLTLDNCTGDITMPTNNKLKLHASPVIINTGTLTANDGNTIEFAGASETVIPSGFFKTNEVSNLITTNTHANGVKMGGDLKVINSLDLTTKFLLNNFTLHLSGTVTNTATNKLVGSPSSNLVLEGADKSIQFDQSVASNFSLNDITLTSGRIDIPNSSSLILYGDLNLTEGSLTANSNNTIEFAGTSAQTIPSNFFTNNSITNITINNTSNVTLYGTLKISGIMTKTAGYLDANSQLPFLELNGSSTQTIPTGFLKDSKVANLKIDNSSDVIIEDDVIITSQLNLGIGDIITDDNAIVVQDNAIVINADENSYIYGNCSKIGDDEFTFPVGSATVYAPLSITAPSVNTTKFTAYYRTADPEIAIGSNKATNVDGVNSCQYWDLHRDIGTCNVKISLAWSTDNNCDINAENVEKLNVLHWSGTKWELVDNDTITGCETLGCITSKVVSSFSPFTLGFEKTSSLPVSLTSFISDCKDNSTILEWQTATELNNNYFEVQRSRDAKTWEKVTQIKGAGNSNQTLNYSYLDKNNDGSFLFYRLKQVDFNGDFTYSNNIVSSCNNSLFDAASIKIYPNPANDNLSIYLSKVLEDSDFTISNSFGQVVIKGKISTETTSLDVSKLMNGIYYIKISGMDKTYKFTKF